jgi:hypothetical protein
MRRLGVLLVLAALLTGCDPLGKASLDPAFGARVTDGRLQVWTGSRCVGATGVGLSFEPGKAELELRAQAEGGVEVEYLTLGGPYPGLQVFHPLPEGFDWRTQESMHFGVEGGSSQWGVTMKLAEVIRGSDQHPPDTYWFPHVGWLNRADVAAQDGKTFLGLCTPNPGKKH